MSVKLSYRKGPRCGYENCPSAEYAQHDDGLTYCKHGHQQEVREELNQPSDKLTCLHRVSLPEAEMKKILPLRGRSFASKRRLRSRFHEVSHPIHCARLLLTSI